MTRSYLDQAINQRTLVFANPDVRWRPSKVSAALAKYQPQEIGTANFQLPLSGVIYAGLTVAFPGAGQERALHQMGRLNLTS